MDERLTDSDEGRRAADHMAARLCTQVQELRTFGITAVVGRVAVSPEKYLPPLLYMTKPFVINHGCTL